MARRGKLVSSILGGKSIKGIGDLCPYLSRGVENQVREVWVEGFHAVRGALMERVGPSQGTRRAEAGSSH